MKLLITTIIASFFICGIAYAKPYGPAGCGLGSMLMGKKAGFTQVFAATTNGSSANQTFGISSGTSNCGASKKGAKAMNNFIETNREALAKDVARGHGETINSIAKIAGCKNVNIVGKHLKTNFKSIFPSAAATNKDIVKNVMSKLKSSALLCTNIG
jgi:hypothetical protein